MGYLFKKASLKPFYAFLRNLFTFKTYKVKKKKKKTYKVGQVLCIICQKINPMGSFVVVDHIPFSSLQLFPCIVLPPLLCPG